MMQVGRDLNQRGSIQLLVRGSAPMPLCACHHVHCFEREQGSTDHVITRLQLQALMPLWMQQQRSLMAQQCLGVASWALEQAVRQRQGLAAAVAPQKTRSTPRVLEWGSLEAVL